MKKVNYDPVNNQLMLSELNQCREEIMITHSFMTFPGHQTHTALSTFCVFVHLRLKGLYEVHCYYFDRVTHIHF
jgi:hypothetical protein